MMQERTRIWSVKWTIFLIAVVIMIVGWYQATGSFKAIQEWKLMLYTALGLFNGFYLAYMDDWEKRADDKKEYFLKRKGYKRQIKDMHKYTLFRKVIRYLLCILGMSIVVCLPEQCMSVTTGTDLLYNIGINSAFCFGGLFVAWIIKTLDNRRYY